MEYLCSFVRAGQATRNRSRVKGVYLFSGKGRRYDLVWIFKQAGSGDVPAAFGGKWGGTQGGFGYFVCNEAG